MYRALYQMHITGSFSSKWVQYISMVLNDSGFSCMWQRQNIPNNAKWFSEAVKLRIHDQFCQKWTSELRDSAKCTNYRIVKNHLQLEPYLINLPIRQRHIMTNFRCRNHRLPIEAGRLINIERDARFCTFCDGREIGDEFHFLFKCTRFDMERSRYLKHYFSIRPNTVKFHDLFNSTSTRVINNLVKFVKIIIDAF